MAETLTKDVVRIRVDEIREGKLYKCCPGCAETREVNEFGLCRLSQASENGADVITTHHLCRTCQGDAVRDAPTTWNAVLRIACDEIRDQHIYRRCPKCAELKEINIFGLRRAVGAAKGAMDVFSAQAWCRPCRTAVQPLLIPA